MTGTKIANKGIIRKNRDTFVTKPDCHAVCMDCDWTQDSSNALGLAALHADREGHEVGTEVFRRVRYVPVGHKKYGKEKK